MTQQPITNQITLPCGCQVSETTEPGKKSIAMVPCAPDCKEYLAAKSLAEQFGVDFRGPDERI